jgi:AcrR family transcriptional regulator
MARRTRQRVVETAHRLLLEYGYTGLTMTALADAAGVSVAFLYQAFGPKPELVKRVYDVVLAGDDDPVPIAQRPAAVAFRSEPDPRRKVRLYAESAGELAGRVGPLLHVVLAAARAGEPELRELVAALDGERLAGATRVAGHLAEIGALAPGLTADRARDLVWLHISPDVHRMLVLERGWSHEEYTWWFDVSLAAALLPPGHRLPRPHPTPAPGRGDVDAC